MVERMVLPHRPEPFHVKHCAPGKSGLPSCPSVIELATGELTANRPTAYARGAHNSSAIDATNRTLHDVSRETRMRHELGPAHPRSTLTLPIHSLQPLTARLGEQNQHHSHDSTFPSLLPTHRPPAMPAAPETATNSTRDADGPTRHQLQRQSSLELEHYQGVFGPTEEELI